MTHTAISLFIPGVPVGKGRPRMTRSGFVYTPEKTRIYEDKVAFCGHEAMKGASPMEGPLRLEMLAVFPVPESWSKRKRNEALLERIFPGKPDIDNILKTLDGLNGVVWKDDSQVAQAVIRKRYGETPGLTVVVYSMAG